MDKKEKQEKKTETKEQEKPKTCKENKEMPAEQNPAEQKIAELVSTLQHVQAEFENYRKRVERLNEEHKKFAKKELITKLLPILDNFELALKNKTLCKCRGSDEDDGSNAFIKGIEMIYSSMHSLLESEGVKKIDAVGKMFDPELHEVLMAEESDEKENTVIEEFQHGYKLHSRVIRHAKVKIAKKKEMKEDNDKK